jgi:hypothetical protein
MDPAIAAAVEKRAAAIGVRVLAVRRPGRTPRGVRRRWVLADTRDAHESLRWGSFGQDAELATLPLDADTGAPDSNPLYLVCTHGRHDACCALRGRPVAAALERERPGRVWECSHVGGERFAANLLLLPSGLLYGRVLPFAAAEFVAAVERGEVVGALLRGRVGLPPAAQAALGFAYEHLALRRRDTLRVLTTSPVAHGEVRVHLAGPHGRLQVTVQVETVAAEGLTCAEPREGRYFTYKPVRIDVLAD